MLSVNPVAARPVAEAETGDLLIECASVVKRYGGSIALNGANFTLRKGEVHALLGQNGAGKSTLIKILSGVVQRDDGIIKMAGVPVDFRNARAAQDAGVAVVYQDLSLAPNLSVAGSLLLGREPLTRYGLVNRKAMLRLAREIMSDFGLAFDPNALVGELPFAQRQLLEIAKALSRKPGILILDEPTSALAESEEAELFEAIGRLLKRGVGVIYVTHRLKEVFQIAHRVSVFRDGANVLTCGTHDTDIASLVTAIAGKSTPTRPATVHAAVRGEVRLALRDIHASRVNGVSMDLRRGEIVGLAGIVGSGRTDILEAIYGTNRVGSGSMNIDGKAYAPSGPAEAIRRGVALVPEDRHRQGLALDHSIGRNMSVPRLGGLSRWGFLRSDAADRRSRSIMRRLSIKAPDHSAPARTLSGGNQQKVVFGKWMEPDPLILLLDEPTVGVDVGARPEIYGAATRMAEAGACVLVVSSEMEELLILCSRIGVVSGGRIVHWIDRSAFSGEDDLHRLVQVHS